MNRKTRLGWWQLRSLFEYLVWRANEQEHLRVWCSQDTMLRDTRFPSKRDVQNGLRDLQDLQLITKVGKHGRADVYEVSTWWLPPEHRQVSLPDDRQRYLPDDACGKGRVTGQDHGHGNGHGNGQVIGQVIGQEYLPQTELKREHKPNASTATSARRTSDGDARFDGNLVGARLRRILDESIAEGQLESAARRLV